jgi:REP element-mobilizing transposase RayT
MIPETIYHIYNRGNNSQKIYFEERNYPFFLKKVKISLLNEVDMLAYCLMPNHFHFLVWTKSSFINEKFSTAFRLLLSSYTRALQRQEHFTGSLFQQNSKIKEVDEDDYALTCFHYIHQNPVRARLVAKIEDWAYSSFNEYWKGGSTESTGADLCNLKLARQLLDLPESSDLFYRQSIGVISDDILGKFF